MNEQEKEEYGTKIANLLTDHLLIKSITTLGSNITISGEIFGNATLEDISRALTSHGVKGSITLRGSDAEIRIKLQSDEIAGIPIINILLFVATIITTTLAGAMMEGVTDPFSLEGIISGLPFSITLLSILLFHEFGHYFASKRNNVTATLPYFIPAPTFIGTFGAFIKMKSPIIDRKSLLEIGAAGPIAGFLVAVPALYYGLSTSEVLESVGGAGIHLGDSIIMMILTSLIHPNIADGYDIYLSSIAFAGWIG
ncbi:MAG: site-2 protease family protein, partial [Candidatus Marinimicrobia bacterium]|nr:site-2 protease family protein [Candidatus Neomarinimicrobiota bacterium]